MFGGVVEIGIRLAVRAGGLPRGAHHCQPRLVCEVQHLAGSEAFRHAVPRALRVVD